MSDPRDPGWRVFGVAADSPPLPRLRLVILFFVAALASFILILLFLTDPEDLWRAGLEQDWALWILVAGAAASLLGTGWARGRPLFGTTHQALSGSYSTRFLVGIAFAESAAPDRIHPRLRHEPAVALSRGAGGFAGRVRADGPDGAEHQPRRRAPPGRGITGLAVGRADRAPGSEPVRQPLVGRP